jgi:sulfur-oxidizing protein SoxA
MEKLQGISAADYVKRPHPGGGQPVKDLGAMATYVASKSAGRSSPRRSATRRSARRSRSARRCSSPLRPVRFRLRDLPRQFRPAHPPAGPALSRGEEGGRKVIGEWPAYRVSTTHVMTMQHRMFDCFWQMRMPELQLGSEASVALIAFLTKQAGGGEIAAPGLKR